MGRRTSWLVLLSPFLCASLTWAGAIASQHQGVPYSAVLTVDQTSILASIDFNADNVQDSARVIILRHAGGDAAYCQFRGVGVPEGAPLHATLLPEVQFVLPTGQPVKQVVCCTAPGEGAVVYVIAMP